MEEKEEDIPKEYEDFNDQVFNKAIFEKLPDWYKWDHAIELIPNAMLKDYKVYPLNVKEQEELNKFLEEHLKSGQIWLSKSPCIVTLYKSLGKISDNLHSNVTNFIWSYLHQFFDDSHGLKASLKPLRRPFDRYQSRLKAINNGWDIKHINW